MEATRNARPTIPRPPSKGTLQRKRQEFHDFQGTLSSKELRIRQNYIINRDMAYTSIQNQFDEISTKPQFLRFISLKKTSQPRIDHIAREIVRSHQQKRKDPQAKNRLRQRILFQKMKRPEHNSPIKHPIRIKQTDTESSSFETPQEQTPRDKKRKRYCQSDDENSMMLKQMVTHMEPRGSKVMTSTPYTDRSRHKYFVAEAVKDYMNRDSLVRDHIFNSMYFLQLLVKYDKTTDYAEDKPIYMPQNPKYKDKITVVLDLDETLVHCFQQLSQKHQVQITVNFSTNNAMIAPVNIRPHAVQFLQQLSQQFELIIFTASHEAYANAVINYLDPDKKFIAYRLFRRHCDYIDEGYYVKDLRILGRDLAKTVIVDNAAYSYAFQVANGIPIISYYEGQTDYQLVALKEYLLSLRQCEDVRVVNEKTFKQSRYVGYTTVEELVEELYLGKK